MEVQDYTMFHYHKLGLYDDIWVEGNALKVDEQFRSYYGTILERFSTSVSVSSNKKVSFDRIIKQYLNQESIDPNTTRKLLEEARRIIINTNIYNREMNLEEYRKKCTPHLPSRLHSIWVTDAENLKFWEDQLSKTVSLALFKLSLSGNLFKSSDVFIPDDELCMNDMYLSSENYWNPTFQDSAEKIEYLFHGNVKILQRMR